MRLTISTIVSLTLACTPGSLKLGEETETETASEATSEPTTDGPGTTGEPVAEGMLVWSEILDDTAAVDIAVGPDGTLVVIGERGYTPQGDGGVFASRWMAKFGPDGSTVWVHEEPNTEESYPVATSVDVGPGGDIFVGVVDFSALEGAGNVVRRLDPEGEELWSATLPARANVVQATPDGGVIVGGGKSVVANHVVAWAEALDADGAPRWEQTYGDPEMRGSAVVEIAVDGDEVIFAGSMGVEPISSRAKGWLHRAALATGAEVWDRTVTEAVATDYVGDIGVTADGRILGLVVAGGVVNVRAYSSAGEELWQFTPELATGGSTLAVASDGAFTLADGLYLPIEDPNACFGSFSPCPVRMRVERRAADQSARWQVSSDLCREGRFAVTMPDDGVVVLAGCAQNPDGDVAIGLLRYAP